MEPITNSDDLITVDNVYFAYNSDVVLEDISFCVTRGSFLSIIGPSGCGKSTLLSLIQGLRTPSHGRIRVDGADVKGPSGPRATVFQHFALLPWKTVLQNIELGLRYRGVAKAAARRTAREYVQLTGLSGWEDRYPATLSGGMQQRVGIARALALNPTLLLLDEPFGALDAQNAEILRVEVSRMVRDAEVTAALVTHNLDEALSLSDRVLIMGANPGRIIEDVDVATPRAGRKRFSEWPTTDTYRHMRDRLWTTLKTEVIRAQAAALGTREGE